MRIRGLFTFLSYFIIGIIRPILALLLGVNDDLTLFILLISNLLVLLIGLKINSKELTENIKKFYNVKSTYKMYGIGIAFYFLAIIVISVIANVLIDDTSTDNQVAIVNALKNSNLIISFLVIVIVGPLSEELVFRYSVVNLFDVKVKLFRWVPYLASILLFALIHESKVVYDLNVENVVKFFIYAAPASVLVIIYALSKRNFITVCLLHMTINLISFIGMVQS